LLRVVCASADHPRGSPSCRNNSDQDALPMVGWRPFWRNKANAGKLNDSNALSDHCKL
jgi:hypothetical protein